MDAVELRQLTTILVVTGDLLTDIGNAGPELGLPAGLWQPIAESLHEVGAARRVIQFDDGPYGLMRTDSLGSPLLIDTQASTSAGPALERAVRFLLMERAGANNPSFDQAASEHGLRGAPLVMKARVVETGYETYVANGRVTEISKGRPSRVRRAFSRLKDALGPCGTVLDSVSALPQMGYVKLAGEGVEMIQHAIGFARGRNAGS